MQMLKKVYPSTFKTVKSHNTNSNQYAAFEIYPPGGMENMVQKDIRLKSRSFEVMKESVINESSRDRMIKQIKSYKKRGAAMVTLPSKVRDFYFKNKEEIDQLDEELRDDELNHITKDDNVDKILKEL